MLLRIYLKSDNIRYQQKKYIVYVYCIMVKMVSLSNKAYAELKDIKNIDESFSDVILRLLKNTKDIKQFAGILKDHKSELDLMEERITEDRKNNNGRYQ